MGSNEIEFLSQEVSSEGVFDGRQKKDLKQMEIKSRGENERFGGASSEEDESVQVSSSLPRGLCLILLSESVSSAKQLIVMAVK